MKTITLAVVATLACANIATAADYARPQAAYHMSKAEKDTIAAKIANGNWTAAFWGRSLLNGN